MTTVVPTNGGLRKLILATLAPLKLGRVAFLRSADTSNVKGSWTQVAGEGKVIRSKPDRAASPSSPGSPSTNDASGRWGTW
jgi:hypothetical protein